MQEATRELTEDGWIVNQVRMWMSSQWAVRAGRAFVDVQGTRDRLLEVTLVDRSLTLRVAHAPGGRLVLSGPAAAGLSHAAPLGDDETVTLAIPAGRTGWLRAEVRGPDGALWLLGNPVYLEASARR